MGNLKERIQDYLWTSKEIAKEIGLALLPNTQKEKEAFLEEVKDRVNRYQPLIEERCRISLGDIKVKDAKYLLSETIYGLAYDSAFEKATSQGRIPTKRDFNSSFRDASISELITYIPLQIIISLGGGQYCTTNNTIYVPFTFSTRFCKDFEEKLSQADLSIVHEISHILWKKILDKSSIKIKNNLERMWQEGFATYCAEEYFLDFYPRDVDTYLSWMYPKIYQDGKKKVEKLVEKKGIESLLEIPKRWEEFEKEIE